jgi:hypothetical protein
MEGKSQQVRISHLLVSDQFDVNRANPCRAGISGNRTCRRAELPSPKTNRRPSATKSLRWGLELPSDEQAVVDEFSGVTRRYMSLNQDPTVLARLVGVAFNRSLGAREFRGDKLARAQLRGLEVRQQLAESAGGSLSSDEVARRLRISKTAVLKRLAAGRLLAWREERLQAARFPRWQFDDNGHVISGLEEVLEILNGIGGLDPWAKFLFFLQSRIRPDGRRPLDQLREGQVKPVVQAAQAYSE